MEAGYDAVKCNLRELTKSACISLVVSGVDTYALVSDFHMLVDHSVVCAQKVFSGVL